MLKTNRKSKIYLTCRSSLTKRNNHQSVATTPKDKVLPQRPFQLFQNIHQNNITIKNNNYTQCTKPIIKEQSISSIVINDQKHNFDKYNQMSIEFDQTQKSECQVQTFFGDHRRNISAVDSQSMYDLLIQSIKIDCKRKEKCKQAMVQKEKIFQKKQLSENYIDIQSILISQQTLPHQLNQIQTQSIKLKIEKIKSEVLGLNQILKKNCKMKKIEFLLTEVLQQFQGSQKKNSQPNHFQTPVSKQNKSNTSPQKKHTYNYNSFYQFKSNIINKENEIRKASVKKFITESNQANFDQRDQDKQVMKNPFQEIMSRKKKRN